MVLLGVKRQQVAVVVQRAHGSRSGDAVGGVGADVLVRALRLRLRPRLGLWPLLSVGVLWSLLESGINGRVS